MRKPRERLRSEEKDGERRKNRLKWKRGKKKEREEDKKIYWDRQEDRFLKNI